MDSLSLLTPSAALKLVEVYQLAHDINQIHQDQLFIQRQNDLLYGQILEQKVALIFQSISTKIFMEGLQDLIIFIDERLAIEPSKIPSNYYYTNRKASCFKKYTHSNTRTIQYTKCIKQSLNK
jgi:hypothetical protein